MADAYREPPGCERAANFFPAPLEPTLQAKCRSQPKSAAKTSAAAKTRREAMSNPEPHHTINYIEFSTTDVQRTKQFYTAVFGWSFKDWGPDYISFHGAGIDGGFAKTEPHGEQAKFAPLVVLYSTDLKATEAAIVAAGGAVALPAFEFPGGRRFHFSDGAGNLLGVWSK
jgi:predicted enzyme related to lactoylglutathione lyase